MDSWQVVNLHRARVCDSVAHLGKRAQMGSESADRSLVILWEAALEPAQHFVGIGEVEELN
ncbi:hypothetical protein ADK78_40715 [Kitasatospora aureofaciens]|nr:hypothetical protein ADK78_40715 [Kitasatospora aureofaciens]